MFVITNKYLIGRRFAGVTLWPFIILKRKELAQDRRFMNHEYIHLRQQLELFIVPFYLLYFMEYIFRLIQFRDFYKAYRNISFEREAYAKEWDLSYLENRSFWAHIQYLWHEDSL
ncbi:hypothetical protein GCM10009117_05190 [Gangjinia marincola]|uniref:Peptidase M56 domain-containing protein n=1 Tax=Gangjinia marincola TaxID=578463 RepID=A0ABP3XT69_9FLAO